MGNVDLGQKKGTQIRVFSLVAPHPKVSGTELMSEEGEGRPPILYVHPGTIEMTPFSQRQFALCPADPS